jgi:hypothetical protein
MEKSEFQYKYFKYRSKYLKLLRQIGGVAPEDDPIPVPEQVPANLVGIYDLIRGDLSDVLEVTTERLINTRFDGDVVFDLPLVQVVDESATFGPRDEDGTYIHVRRDHGVLRCYVSEELPVDADRACDSEFRIRAIEPRSPPPLNVNGCWGNSLFRITVSDNTLICDVYPADKKYNKRTHYHLVKKDQESLTFKPTEETVEPIFNKDYLVISDHLLAPCPRPIITGAGTFSSGIYYEGDAIEPRYHIFVYYTNSLEPEEGHAPYIFYEC